MTSLLQTIHLKNACVSATSAVKWSEDGYICCICGDAFVIEPGDELKVVSRIAAEKTNYITKLKSGDVNEHLQAYLEKGSQPKFLLGEFSRIGCGVDGSCLLALITTDHSVFLYHPSIHATSRDFEVLVNVTELYMGIWIPDGSGNRVPVLDGAFIDSGDVLARFKLLDDVFTRKNKNGTVKFVNILHDAEYSVHRKAPTPLNSQDYTEEAEEIGRKMFATALCWSDVLSGSPELPHHINRHTLLFVASLHEITIWRMELQQDSPHSGPKLKLNHISKTHSQEISAIAWRNECKPTLRADRLPRVENRHALAAGYRSGEVTLFNVEDRFKGGVPRYTLEASLTVVASSYKYGIDSLSWSFPAAHASSAAMKLGITRGRDILVYDLEKGVLKYGEAIQSEISCDLAWTAPNAPEIDSTVVTGSIEDGIVRICNLQDNQVGEHVVAPKGRYLVGIATSPAGLAFAVLKSVSHGKSPENGASEFESCEIYGIDGAANIDAFISAAQITACECRLLRPSARFMLKSLEETINSMLRETIRKGVGKDRVIVEFLQSQKVLLRYISLWRVLHGYHGASPENDISSRDTFFDFELQCHVLRLLGALLATEYWIEENEELPKEATTLLGAIRRYMHLVGIESWEMQIAQGLMQSAIHEIGLVASKKRRKESRRDLLSCPGCSRGVKLTPDFAPFLKITCSCHLEFSLDVFTLFPLPMDENTLQCSSCGVRTTVAGQPYSDILLDGGLDVFKCPFCRLPLKRDFLF